MKRPLVVLIGLAFTMMASIVFAETQHIYAWWCILPTDDPSSGSVTENNGEYISPLEDAAFSSIPLELSSALSIYSGLRVQYWIVSPDYNDILYDNPANDRKPTRFDPYSQTLRWTPERAFTGSTALYVGARFYYVTNTVCYHSNADKATGSTPASSLQCFTNSYAISECAFALTGYTFQNWTNSTGKSFSSGQIVTGADLQVTNNLQVIDMYAVWAANNVNLSYDLAGGTPGSYQPSKVAFDEEFKVSDPSRVGYRFLGWKVTSGLDSRTAKYRSDELSWSSVSSYSQTCLGEGGQTYFKNLRPDSSQEVVLTAVWEARSTVVHFNIYDASTGPSERTYTFDEPLYSVQVPTWNDGSKSFLGYYTEPNGQGECYWDQEGQPIKETWDIESENVIFYAHTESSVYYITYDPNGRIGEKFSVMFTNGVPITLSNGSTFSGQGSELLGWSTLPTAGVKEYSLGEQVAFRNKTSNFSLYAIWKDYYYVSFDGNGATNEHPMAVQRFPFNESQALSANKYGRTGYLFEGWATSLENAQSNIVTYADRQVVENLENTVAATNNLFAVWSPISYLISFDASQYSGVKFDDIECVYDVSYELPIVPYKEGELWKHIGWSNTFNNAVYLTNEVSSVSNLSATAGSNIKLVAVWESMVGDLSKAMDIYNLRWVNQYPGFDESWRVQGGISIKGNSSVAQTGAPTNRRFWEMTTSVTNSGVLTFYWKTASGIASLYYESDQKQNESFVVEEFASVREWTRVTISIKILEGEGYSRERSIYLSPSYSEGEDTIYIDNMTWTPEGSVVEPGIEDVREISEIYFDGSSPVLSFSDADERFSYNLRGTNDLIQPLASWPVLWTTNGTGTIIIKPPYDPTKKQMFFYLETKAK